MLSENEKKHVIKMNKRITDAIIIYKAFDTKNGKKSLETLLKCLNGMEKEYRFQDILGIKDEALKDQKGIVTGINLVINYIKKLDKLSFTPRRDPDTGEEEKIAKKK